MKYLPEYLYASINSTEKKVPEKRALKLNLDKI